MSNTMLCVVIIMYVVFDTIMPVETVCKEAHILQIEEFQHIPYADKNGILMHTRILELPSEKRAPYNAAIERLGATECYMMAFRSDYRCHTDTHLYGIMLDKDFAPITPITELAPAAGERPQDPRLFWCNDTLHMMYVNDRRKNGNTIATSMCALDKRLDPHGHTQLLYNQDQHQKNWVPLVYKHDAHKESLYCITNHAVCELVLLDATGSVQQVAKVQHALPALQAWHARWGEIRGGTPALRLNNGDYLTFFHSSFRPTRKREKYYCIGALQLAGKPPFLPKKISQYPILFDDCYTAPIHAHAKFFKQPCHPYVLFPSGLVAGSYKKTPAFCVTCGENDSSVRLLVFDQKKLLESLMPV